MNRPSLRLVARGERGAALITMILLMVLISVLVVSFITNVSSERAMSSNVHISRAAIYAADAGVRVAQQNLANIAQPRLDSLITAYNNSGPVIKTPSTFFPSGAMTSSSTSPKFDASTTVIFIDSLMSVASQIYNYKYTVTSTGTRGTLGTRTIQSQGVLKLSTGRGSYADYLLFTDKHTAPDGGSIWFTSSGSFAGRMHTNTQYRFHGTPRFDDLISSVNSKAWFYNGGDNKEVNDDHYGSVDVPRLYGGFKRNQGAVTLPTNQFNQQNAALGLDPTSYTAPSNSTIRTQLEVTSGSSSDPPPNGVYIPNTLLTITGGIYVQGNATLLAQVDAGGKQQYVFTQGGKTWTITINKTLNITKFDDGSTTTTLFGAPRGIVYTQGSITDFGGPDRSGSTIPPALANGTQLLITATDDIIINNDVIYEDYHNGDSVLGLFAADDVRVGSGAPNDMELNGYVMATGSSGCMTVDNYSSGSPRGTFHLNGGIVASYYGAFGTFSSSSGAIKTGYARDFHYDNRGMVPPYYPTSSQVVANVPKARTLVWKEQ